MEKLVITQEYKFKIDGSCFYISEGEGLKVKTREGTVFTGVLVEIGGISECFDIETNDGIVTIDCENVVDIMPV